MIPVVSNELCQVALRMSMLYVLGANQASCGAPTRNKHVHWEWAFRPGWFAPWGAGTLNVHVQGALATGASVVA